MILRLKQTLRTLRFVICALLLITTPALPLAGPALADEGPHALLSELRDSYRGVNDLTARFVQTATLPGVGMENVTGGEVIFARGGKMRWRYEGDDPQTIISDGTTLWIYQERDRSVIRRSLAELSPAGRVALDLLSGLEQVEEHFTLSDCGARCVELIPTQTDPDLARVRVELDGQKSVFHAITTEDPLGNTTRVELSEIQTDTGVSTDTFRFQPPEGVEVFGEKQEALP